MMRVGVTRNKRHLYDTLEGMRKRARKLVWMYDYGTAIGLGRLPTVYFLTPFGADLLAKEIRRDGEIIPVHKKKPRKVNSQYLHRLYCVDFHIAFWLWAREAGAAVDFFHAYYDPWVLGRGSGALVPRTHMRLRSGKTFIPDAVLSFTMPDDVQRVCVFEMWRGRPTDVITKRHLAISRAIEEEIIERTFKYDHEPRILSVFDNARGMELVQERLAGMAGFTPFSPLFFAKTCEEIEASFVEGWHQLNGGTLAENQGGLTWPTTTILNPMISSFKSRTMARESD